MREIIKKDLNMGMESFIGLITRFLKGISRIMIYRDLEAIFGKMEGYMKENGYVIRCREKGSLFGRMEGCIKGSMSMIRKKGLESLCGRVGRGMWVSGGMGSSMVKGILWMYRERRWKVSGEMERGLKVCN